MRKKHARKPAPDDPTTMTMRITQGELAAFHRAAEGVGLSLASWCRSLCRRAAGLPTV